MSSFLPAVTLAAVAMVAVSCAPSSPADQRTGRSDTTVAGTAVPDRSSTAPASPADGPCARTTTPGSPGRPTPTPNTDGPFKVGTRVFKTDVAPLVTRFPALDGAVAACWQSGTFGESRVPGPSTYWIDAVVTMPPATVEQWRRQHATQPVTAQPDVFEDMIGRLPEGPLTASPGLDAVFDVGTWYAKVFLGPDGKVVLVATGM